MLIDKNALPLVAMDNMNEVHFEDVDIINDLSSLLDDYAINPSDDLYNKINQQYEKWFEHTINHFAGEEEMMQEKNFFAYPMHKAEHTNALQVMQDVYGQWKQGKNIQALKQYVQQDCIQWLLNHIQSMDTVTAMYLKTGQSPCHSF
ncbi:MAG: hemerythrin family protein [Arcobacter sp.]|nr:hemerythrin family protein [Arcobacter sp.]